MPGKQSLMPYNIKSFYERLEEAVLLVSISTMIIYIILANALKLT